MQEVQGETDLSRVEPRKKNKTGFMDGARWVKAAV
jgi:hypothetical protein